MGIRQMTNDYDLMRTLDAFLDGKQKATIRLLSYIGEKAITIARSSHPNDYKDQTGNLRSSIGYKIAHNGRIVGGSSFEVVKDGKNGASDGKKLAEKFAIEHSAGSFCLVLVAGMNYAFFVEKGHTNKSNGRYIPPKDVLTSAELKARQLAERLLKA